ncbi:MAG: IS200/IS605 family transposase [Flavobacteriales bacterium]|nr:IS200/IS605 family transposase [Flavobacteriales bacterium]
MEFNAKPAYKPASYSRNYQHVVFAVKYREALIEKVWKEELHKYITGFVQNNGMKLLAIHAMPDHIHILFHLRSDVKLSDFVKELKVSSTNFINRSHLSKSKFNWQNGFGNFSVSHDHIARVVGYIHNQETHHEKHSFQMEYKAWLKHYEIDFDERFLFDWIEND